MKKFLYGIILVLIVIVSIFLALPLMEHAARYYYRDITTTGDTGSYFTKQWLLREFGRDLVKLNSWRTREREFDVQKPSGVYRIVVMGDSLTFGQGIREDERFTNLIQARLDKTGLAFEILNIGKMGAQTYHELNLFYKLTEEMEMDFVLLQWFVNDFEGYDYSHRPAPVNLFPRRKAHERYRRHSVLYFVLNTWWHRLQSWVGTVDTYADYMVERFGAPDSPHSQPALDDLGAFVRIAQRNDIPVGIVLFPVLTPELASDYPFDSMHEQVLAVCAGQAIQCLDLRDTYRPYADNVSRLHVNQFDAHPSAFANTLATDSIMQAFSSQWMERASAIDPGVGN